jgi:hypothetical protein
MLTREEVGVQFLLPAVQAGITLFVKLTKGDGSGGAKEYCMIYRGPGFLAHPLPLPSVSSTSDQRWAKGPMDRSSDTDSIFRFYRTIQSVDVKFRFLYRPVVSVRFEFRFFNRPILFLGLKFQLLYRAIVSASFK